MKKFEEDVPGINQRQALSILLLGFTSTLMLSSVVVTCVMNWFTLVW